MKERRNFIKGRYRERKNENENRKIEGQRIGIMQKETTVKIKN